MQSASDGAPVNVYHRQRYLAEVHKDKPYPTRTASQELARDLRMQIHTLREAEQPRASRVMIKSTERAEIISALENAIALIESLPRS